MIDESIRPRIRRIARAMVGLSAAPEHVEQFAAFIGGPGEDPKIAHAMVTYRDPKTGRSVSCCAEFIRALERDAGIVDHRLVAPFRVSLVFTDILELARERRALTTLGPGDEPDGTGGNVIIVDGDKSDGHMYLSDEKTEDGVFSFDSGVTDAHGNQAVHARRKRWTKGLHGYWYDQADDGGPQRRITDVIDIEKLAGES
jgi:hypothetical protein